MVVVNYKKERIVSPHEALRCALPRHVLHAGRSPRLPPPVPKVVLRLAGKRPKGVRERERVECDYKKGITGSLLVTVIIIAVHIVTVIIITVFIRLVIMLRTTILLQPLSC